MQMNLFGLLFTDKRNKMNRSDDFKVLYTYISTLNSLLCSKLGISIVILQHKYFRLN